ncbi:hypothetical protein [Arthrobacter zhaoguopingii]|uniref:hypothetical protein n=1 Tax=Arthrobacter zhaoguopingii TaxID=2681491 RepID=UPI00135C4CB7|nr:hypothetical protein [Arthrobacter zhaoguopingii]
MGASILGKQAAAAGLGLALLLGGCAGNAARPGDGDLPAFASIEEAREAIGEVMPCGADPLAEPTANMIAGFTPEYAMCSENVQVEFYATEDDREASAKAYSNSGGTSYTRIPVNLVEGRNWLVLDLSEARGADSQGGELKRLAEELDARFTQVEGVKSSS